jgi:23S rRNA (pseudouridine1915-N3)-methyltransferase
VAVGKLRDVGLRSLCDDYRSRIRRHVAIEESEARDDRTLQRQLLDSAWVVALDPNGEEFTSTQFAERLNGWLQLGKPEIDFVIGGADGIPRAVLDRADAKVSLSRLTLPHRLARVLLFEQLYRAFAILQNEPYAREG